jgi:hypothetical protein
VRWRSAPAAWTVAAGSAAAIVVASLRARSLRWGASDEELNIALPGDELVPDADLKATRAVTVKAGAKGVWPWIAQLGQGRGGFYSYDFLENLVGLDIHSAERIVSEWQAIEVGDEVKFHPEGGMIAAVVEPARALVLRGGMPMGRRPPFDFAWAFVVRGQPDGTTRLVVRERYRYLRWWAPLLVEPVEFISLVMSRRMMRGIKDRAERAVLATSVSGASEATTTIRRRVSARRPLRREHAAARSRPGRMSAQFRASAGDT